MAKAFPKSRFWGYDFSREATATGRKEAKKMRLKNARFKAVDAAKMVDKKRFDLVTAFDTIHDQARPDRVLKAINRALRKGGTFLMQDIAGSSNMHENIGSPMAPAIYTISTMHCMTVSLAYRGMGLHRVGRTKGKRDARRGRVWPCARQPGGRRHIQLLLCMSNLRHNYLPYVCKAWNCCCRSQSP